MFSKIVLVVSLLGLLQEISAQVLQDGQCDQNIALQTNFDPAQFNGTWYEVRSTSVADCASITITEATTGYDFQFVSVVRNFEDNANVVGTLETGTAKFSLNYGVRTEDFWVLGTGYSSYAVVYRCENVGTTQRNVYVKLLSRNRTINDILTVIINNTLATVDLSIPELRATDHSEQACLVLPTIPTGQSVVLPGNCDPNIRQVANFNVSRFLGLWHQQYSYYSENGQGTCNRAQYTLGNGVVNVLNSQVVNTALDTISGSAVLDNNFDSKLLVTLEVLPGVNIAQELYVIATDYDNYAISYTCIPGPAAGYKTVFSWVVSRTRIMPAEVLEDVTAVVDSVLDLNFAYYQAADQTREGCFFYPEPSPDQIVEFRATCNLDIPTVANFQPTRYMGTWYDIESYPSGFQEGTCNTAQYSLRDGVVDVFNTQVVNQALDTMTGVGVVASTDGSAKLEVTFPVAGTNFTVTTSYWVLATDYDHYSLVYTCQYDESTDTRKVWSWKLSKERTLADTYRNEINAVISTIPELDQRYYIVRDFSDEGCFYFPEPSSEPAIFPGTCATNISVVTNFNIADFSGTWYEIAAYPKRDSNTCYRYENTLNSTTGLLTVNAISVFDNNQRSSNWVLTSSSTDGSGRFVTNVDIFGVGNPIEVPVWILAANNLDYVFAYSCFQTSENFRQVSAWKLSRTQELSATANTAINNIVTSIDVLDERYFDVSDRSERSCTVLPDIAAGQPIVLDGQCDPDVEVVQAFEAGRYVGTWHLIETYPSAFQDGSCNDATYTAQEDGSVLVFNTQVINQTLDTITGRAVVASTDGSAKLDVTFPTAPVPTPYWVIATDYRSYSLVYTCINLTPTTRQVWSWKLSRTRSLTAEASQAIDEAMAKVTVLNQKYYQTVDNTPAGCFYYPTPDGNPVSFRGQCDESIPVVTNFDAVAYMGPWYDIESYPQVFQEGSCSTADYELRDGVVNVFNTQVVNQRLDTIVGSAVLTNPNTTEAKLTVTFPVAGTNFTTGSPYWVLATDYESYALVYACQNLPNQSDRRSVSSWKLSRERTLSTIANNAINSVINSIDVLRQDYYEVKGHTDADCFYFPEPTGEPVVYRAQCDNTIQAVPNFDLERFVGVWNEIETYPKDQAGGDCINHEFTVTLSNDTLSLISNQVFNSEDLVTNVGQIRLSSTDGSGRFTLTMNVNGQNIEIPYWVLATDYTTYALVYSCMDRPDGRSAVYAWKLSKTKSLTAEADTNINAAMERVTVLRQEYFVPVSQTDRSCFYLPNIGNREPVIFPGLCDQNIPVIANFNATAYVGTWYDIESYFDDYEGTCIDGTFTHTNNGFNVVLTQVVNQQLDTTLSTATLAADNSGKLIVSTNNVQFEYWILDTDYENWSLVYSCQNVGNNQRRVRSWKMSRSRQLTNAAATAIAGIVNNTDVLNARYFNVRDHSVQGCFYFPEPNGRPVVFRARCDESIPVVQNFNATAYLGQWYNIEVYPQFFQDGTCSAALYTLGDGVVDVYNTQVLNQRLDTMNGTAVVVSNDGSAKLSVTFIVNGVENVAPYWVLATDYVDYAFVYSCRDIDEENVLVSAWKLSRERTLSANAEVVINNVSSTIPVIQQRYYEDVGQTDEDCFFYPENFGGPVVLSGQCPQRNAAGAITNFNANQFAGTWHEVARFPSELQTGECASSRYTVSGQNAFTIDKNIVFNETLFTSSGPGTLGNDGLGVISASLTGDQFSTNLDLYILDTDYNEFALVYACRNIDNFEKQIYSWQLSKTRGPLSQISQDRIAAVVAANIDLFDDYYEPVDQSNDACFYYPEFDVLPEVIELPGPCNENIRGIANFNAERYLGQWYETSRYPQPDQAGACNRAEYTLGNGVVDVYNTQVVNRILEIQRGFAVVASTDGTGQLEVTFEVNGVIVTANYYILDTNYETYSLVYSCRNTANGNRLVSSWKLSREKTLRPEDEQIMSSVITRTQGLRESYYTSTSQSDADCFYVPELDESRPVRFRGQCEDISVGIPNFNVNNFLGLWHEIERYPSGNDDGVCTSANFRSINVVDDKTVFDVTAQINTNTVTISNNGLITRSGSEGTGGSSVWVIATDYNSYALLMSCRNVDDEYREVWSAKHSKTRSLTANAEQAIAGVIASNDLLYQHLYVTVDQSDEACFYYPEVTGRPVTMPGQCDENIPIMTNFSVVEYGGTWYQTERYPQFWETGDCTGARYTLNEATGVVAVTNWQVIDGQLDVIEGNATLIGYDGRARIQVVLPSREEGGDGETVVFELNVLTTDYITYSLAYSCVNLNEYERRLGVWKLSRTRTMPATGTTAINSYMAQRQELDQRYFITVRQDDECEEPASSSFAVRSSVIAVLVCSILQLVL